MKRGEEGNRDDDVDAVDVVDDVEEIMIFFSSSRSLMSLMYNFSYIFFSCAILSRRETARERAQCTEESEIVDNLLFKRGKTILGFWHVCRVLG